jgi:ABC-type lipoprotein export system ATPase subunit
VDGASLEIRQGEFVLIVGRSGSGKTTLLNLAAGLTRPTAGKVLMESTDLWGLTDAQQSFLRGQRIGFVFQFPSLLPALTVHENVILPTAFGSKLGPAAAQERARQLLEKVGLGDKLLAYPRQLSAGQQQRVVIARALMNEPLMLLADEPTSNLDEKTEVEIMDLFRELHLSMGITIVMVTHTRQLASYGTRAVEMAEGRIVNGHAIL